MSSLKIGSVSYSNGLPLTHFLQQPYVTASPAELTEKILKNELDVALLPVASILQHNLQAYPEAGLIGSDGPTQSVGFFVKPHIADLSEIQTLYLDVESRSSALLAQLVLKNFLKRNLKSIQQVPLNQCHLADAQILIGDKALFFSEPGYRFFDLGELWKQHTNHGFIFACWASKKPLSRLVIAELLSAKDKGLSHLDEIANARIEPARRAKTLTYWQNNIVYSLNDSLRKGFELFERLVKEENFFNQSSELNLHYKYLNPSEAKEIFPSYH